MRLDRMTALFLVARLLMTDVQACELSSVEWGPMLVAMGTDCSARVTSPDGRFVLDVSATGRARLLKAQRRTEVLGAVKIEGPLIVGWNPSSHALLINDGKGSGQTSELLLGRFKNGRFQFDARPHAEIVRRFRTASRCSPDQLDPNVWGVGWSAEGRRLLAVAQPVLHEPCGEPASFTCFEVEVASSLVARELQARECRTEWAGRLPPPFSRNPEAAD
jgi:hypothetical protein